LHAIQRDARITPGNGDSRIVSGADTRSIDTTSGIPLAERHGVARRERPFN